MIKAALDENNALVKSETAPRMIGEIKYFAMNTPPSHCLACDGSAVSRTTYAALFAAIGTTWGAGDGSSTFNLPDLRNEWVQGAGTNAVGADIAEGVPNIYGELHAIQLISADGVPSHGVVWGSNNGAFKFATHADTQTGAAVAQRNGEQITDITLDASAVHSVYNAANHVTPKSKALKACIIYE